ncbi:MAG: porin family protein [Polaribacter sp.]|nr:porin family protein [Polaribacter sp.]
MKKGILLICLTFAFSQSTNAQLHFGIKGGLNYNSETIIAVTENVFEGAESKTGYHAGIWLRAKIPVLGIYIRPELIYTNLESSITYLPEGIVADALQTDFSFQKIDIPVLFGKKFLGVGNVFIGPSFQYVLAQDFDLNDIPEVTGDGFTVGLQIGAGIELGKLGIDVRLERGFNDIESRFLDDTTSIEFDTRVNQILIGLSYRF